jgi:hypothetical protein
MTVTLLRTLQRGSHGTARGCRGSVREENVMLVAVFTPALVGLFRPTMDPIMADQPA